MAKSGAANTSHVAERIGLILSSLLFALLVTWSTAGWAQGPSAETSRADSIRAAPGSWTSAKQINPLQGACLDGPYSRPAAGARPDGSLVALWWEDTPSRDDARLVWVERPAGSKEWTPPRQVHPETTILNDARDERVLALADGSVMVTWVIEGRSVNMGPARLLATTLPAGSSIWTAPQVLNDEFAADADVAAGPDGTLYAVWSGQDETGLTHSPRFSLRRPGEVWQPSMVVRTAAPPVYESRGRIGPRVNLRGGRLPQLALGPGGAVLIAWQEDRVVLQRLSGHEVHYRIWSPAAGWSGDQAAAPPESSSAEGPVRRIALAGTKDAFYLLHHDFGPGLSWTMLPAGVSRWSPLKRLPDGSTPSLYARGDQVIASWGSNAALLVQGKEWQLLPKVALRGESIAGLTEHAPFVAFAHRSDKCMIIAITEYMP